MTPQGHVNRAAELLRRARAIHARELDRIDNALAALNAGPADHDAEQVEPSPPPVDEQRGWGWPGWDWPGTPLNDPDQQTPPPDMADGPPEPADSDEPITTPDEPTLTPATDLGPVDAVPDLPIGQLVDCPLDCADFKRRTVSGVRTHLARMHNMLGHAAGVRERREELVRSAVAKAYSDPPSVATPPAVGVDEAAVEATVTAIGVDPDPDVELPCPFADDRDGSPCQFVADYDHQLDRHLRRKHDDYSGDEPDDIVRRARVIESVRAGRVIPIEPVA